MGVILSPDRLCQSQFQLIPLNQDPIVNLLFPVFFFKFFFVNSHSHGLNTSHKEMNIHSGFCQRKR